MGSHLSTLSFLLFHLHAFRKTKKERKKRGVHSKTKKKKKSVGKLQRLTLIARTSGDSRLFFIHTQLKSYQSTITFVRVLSSELGSLKRYVRVADPDPFRTGESVS